MYSGEDEEIEKRKNGTRLAVHSVKCFCLSALCLSNIFPSQSPKAGLIRHISEHK